MQTNAWWNALNLHNFTTGFEKYVSFQIKNRPVIPVFDVCDLQDFMEKELGVDEAAQEDSSKVDSRP